MSIDLYVFEPPGPVDTDEAIGMTEAEPADPSPGPGVARFLVGAERRWPSLDDDPDNSSWTSP